MDTWRPARDLRRVVSNPVRRYLDYKFGVLEDRLYKLTVLVSQADPLERLDLSDNNASLTPPTFSQVVSQTVSAAQFSDASFERLRALVYPGAVSLAAGGSADDGLHRKIWEYMYVLRAAEQYGLLAPGRRAMGLGVGTEPVPAALARHGVQVLATDQEASSDSASDWTATGQHMSGLDALTKPEIVADARLRELVRVKSVDMRAVPSDLGTFDLVWSCCAFEHLGSPEAGLDFVRRTLPLLEPGGISVHTTEFELTARDETADYGNIVVYRKDDLEQLAADVRALGFEMDTNWYVALEAPADRHISLPPHTEPHLKLMLGDSISTSVGLLIRRPT